MHRFGGVRIAALFGHLIGLRHGRYRMTTITTVRRNALLHAFSLQLQVWGVQECL